MRTGLLSCVLGAAVAAASSRAPTEDFHVAFGVMEPATANRRQLRETRTITMDPERHPGLSFIVDPRSEQSYEVYSVHYLPAVPEQLTGALRTRDPAAATQGLTMLPERVKGVHRWDFEFNQGDPLGAYRIDVFVNGTLVAPLAFEVVALPEAPPPRTVEQLLTLFAPILNQPRVISWAIALFGTALCLAPVLWVHRVARQRYPRRLATWAFATLGVVALPLSFWLYLQFYRGSVLALLFGFPGLFLAIFHVWPLAWIHRGTWTDSLGPTLSWSSTAYLTLVWSVAYGIIGLLIDLLRAQNADDQS